MLLSSHKVLFTGIPLFLSIILILSITIYGEEPTKFPHDAHLEDCKCETCHQTVMDENIPGFPTKEVCTDCHDDTEGVDLSPLKDKPLYLNATYPHVAHADVECKDCHGDLAEQDPIIINEVDKCYICHQENDLELSCKDCHEEDRFIPTYHKEVGKWRKRHKYKATLQIKTNHVYDCNVCHKNDACKKCHQSNRPKNHRGYWNRRGHAIKAEITRESCNVCHNEVFCIRCHSNTKPYYHRGSWFERHTNKTNRCRVCHPRIIRLNNSPGGNCSQCHQ